MGNQPTASSIPQERSAVPIPGGMRLPASSAARRARGRGNHLDDAHVQVAFSPAESSFGRASPLPSPSRNQIAPAVIRWLGLGSEVAVAGDWDNFSTTHPLSRTDSSFSVILEVPVGTHRYHFLVDGEWRVAANEPSVADAAGTQFNVLRADKGVNYALTRSLRSSPDGQYGQSMATMRDVPLPEHVGSKKRTGPAQLPAHLMRALLNAHPVNEENPVLMPLPHATLLNHLYTHRKENVVVMGATTRVKSKFVTTILYKPAI